MTSPLTVTRNNYLTNKKSSTIYTPFNLSWFLFNITESFLKTISLDPKKIIILDPAVGTGNLIEPWRAMSYYTIGIDIEDKHACCDQFILDKFENTFKNNFEYIPHLVVLNPPFNGSSGRKLYPEVFLEHIFELWGPQIPVILFVPIGNI